MVFILVLSPCVSCVRPLIAGARVRPLVLIHVPTLIAVVPVARDFKIVQIIRVCHLRSYGASFTCLMILVVMGFWCHEPEVHVE